MKTYKDTVAVYLGSSVGSNPEYAEMVAGLGRRLAVNGHRVVYGGANVGLMKILADAVLEADGQIVGVLPVGFGGKREVQAQKVNIVKDGLTEMIWVKDFAERKATMENLSDCALVLPGGFGSMDELFCYAVGNEIALHDKIAYVLDFNGYYEGLRTQISHMKREGFLPSDSDCIRFATSIDELMEMLG